MSVKAHRNRHKRTRYCKSWVQWHTPVPENTCSSRMKMKTQRKLIRGVLVYWTRKWKLFPSKVSSPHTVNIYIQNNYILYRWHFDDIHLIFSLSTSLLVLQNDCNNSGCNMELILQPLSTTTQQSHLTARYIFKLLPYQKDKHVSNQRKNEGCVYFFSN